jgi:isopenicillin N synthase-like dioxygenase
MNDTTLFNDVRAATSSFTEIPLIDMAPLRKGAPTARKAVADKITEACENVGFLYLVNHSVDAALVSDTFGAAKEFFALPLEQKLPLRLSAQTAFRGYLPSGIDGGTSAGNRKEVFQILRELSETPTEGSRAHILKPNLWPSGLPAFRKTLLAYDNAVEKLSFELLELFAVGLGVPEHTFVSRFKDPLSMLRLLHYPTQSATENAIGSQPHTDSGAVTILAQDDAGGLEAVNDLGQWTKVAPIEGSFVVNIGEMMKLWSDGRFSATPHRVINVSGKDRISIPFFANPDYDEVIAPVISAEKRRRELHLVGHVHRGADMTSGEILTRSWNRLWG